MREKYEQLVTDSTPGRLEGEDRMTAYVDELASEGFLQEDDYWANPDWGEGMIRSGKRIYSWSSSGFVYLEKFATVEEAIKAFHPSDCRYCEAGEVMEHNYEPPEDEE